MMSDHDQLALVTEFKRDQMVHKPGMKCSFNAAYRHFSYWVSGDEKWALTRRQFALLIVELGCVTSMDDAGVEFIDDYLVKPKPCLHGDSGAESEKRYAEMVRWHRMDEGIDVFASEHLISCEDQTVDAREAYDAYVWWCCDFPAAQDVYFFSYLASHQHQLSIYKGKPVFTYCKLKEVA
jgi:hypothetical protein